MNQELPYITKDLEGIGGKIRENSEYFIVEEIPLYEPLGKGEHLYINLTKKNLTTIELQQRLADLFKLNLKAVGFAGMKDKYSIATQTFSLNFSKITEQSIEDIVKKINENIPIKVNWAKLHNNKLRVGHLLGNKFRIIITDLKISQEEALKRANKIAKVIKEKGLPNFFGPQRFGIEGNNVQKGLDLIEGRNIARNKWLRKILLSSYQSYLCNRYLINRVELGLFDKILKGDVAKKYDTGGLFIVEDKEKEQIRYDQKEISFTAPIYGYKMMDAEDEAKEIEDKILKEENMTIDKFVKSKMKGSRRLGRLKLTDLNISPHLKGIELSFSLPKGAFATVILREIMKNDNYIIKETE